MRAIVVAIALLASGCALTLDFDRYSEHYGDSSMASADTDVIDTDVPSDTADTTVVDSGEVDTGTADTDPPDTSCALPEVRCASGCSLLKEDGNNCNACGKVCAAGEYCRNGTCTCMPGLTKCAGQCVDIKGHHDFCGACTTICSLESNTCRFSEPLDGYICTLDKYGCPSGRKHCAMNHCFDIASDETNCGDCGVVCARDEICVSGCKKYFPRSGAVCPSGYKECPAVTGNATATCVAGAVCPS